MATFSGRCNVPTSHAEVCEEAVAKCAVGVELALQAFDIHCMISSSCSRKPVEWSRRLDNRNMFISISLCVAPRKSMMSRSVNEPLAAWAPAQMGVDHHTHNSFSSMMPLARRHAATRRHACKNTCNLSNKRN